MLREQLLWNEMCTLPLEWNVVLRLPCRTHVRYDLFDHNAVRVWSKHVRNYHAKPLVGRWSGSRIELLRYTRKDPKSIQWPKPVYVKPKKLAVKDEFAPSSVLKKIWQWAVGHVLKFWLSPGLMTNDHFILLHKSWFQVSPAVIETWTPSIQ